MAKPEITPEMLVRAFNAGWKHRSHYREGLEKTESAVICARERGKFFDTFGVDEPETPSLDRETFMRLMAEFIDGMDDGNGAYVRAHMDTAFFNMFKLSREKI